MRDFYPVLDIQDYIKLAEIILPAFPNYKLGYADRRISANLYCMCKKWIKEREGTYV